MHMCAINVFVKCSLRSAVNLQDVLTSANRIRSESRRKKKAPLSLNKQKQTLQGKHLHT